MDSCQGRCACGIRDEIGACEIVHIGDPTGEHVGKGPRHAVLAELEDPVVHDLPSFVLDLVPGLTWDLLDGLGRFEIIVDLREPYPYRNGLPVVTTPGVRDDRPHTAPVKVLPVQET